MSIDDPKPTDRVGEFSGLAYAVDGDSLDYLTGCEIHFDDGLSGKGFEIETPTPSPLAGAESLLADGAFAASFGGLGNWLLPLLLACHLQAGTRFHGIGQRAENGCGWKSLLGRLANGSGQRVAHLLGASGRCRSSSPHQVVFARRDESGRTALLTASASEDGASGSTWELRGNALPLSV